MHSFSNRLAFFVLFIMLITFGCIIPKIAANTTMVIFGIFFIFLLLLFVVFLIIRFKVYANLVFKEDKIIQKGFLCKTKEFKYNAYTPIIGNYVSIIENKKAFIFLKKGGPIVNVIDTSKYGNVGQVNKKEIFYCMYNIKLHHLIKNIYGHDLPSDDIYSDAIKRIEEKLKNNSKSGEDLSVISLPEKILYVLHEFDSELQNGGILQYFTNSSKEHAYLIKEYLEKIDAMDFLLLYDEFISTNGIDVNNLDDINRIDCSEFEEFDNQYYELYELTPLKDILVDLIKKYNL